MEDILNISTLSICEKPDTDTVDRLSSLPEHLISDILSRLPIDSAAKTSILSRHWHHQWTYITRFHLSSYNIPNYDELFFLLTRVDDILQKLSLPPNNLRTFDLWFCYRDVDPIENVNELFHTFLPPLLHRLCSSHTVRFEVLEFGFYLHVHIQNAASVSVCSRRIESSAVFDDTLSLPECIFQNKTLVQFKLTTINLSFKLPHYVHLPNLSKLSLDIYDFDRQLMRTLFKSLPLLEDLDISAFLEDNRILNFLNSYNVDELPTFHNLVSLSLELSDAENMNLAIPAWILGRLKTIRVNGLIKGCEYDKEMRLVENILSKANVLERLNCILFQSGEEVGMDSQQKEKDFVKALFMLLRVSSSCEIEFFGSNVHTSTDNELICNLLSCNHSLN